MKRSILNATALVTLMSLAACGGSTGGITAPVTTPKPISGGTSSDGSTGGTSTGGTSSEGSTGGTTTGGNTGQTANAPASTSPADLIAFAMNGGTTSVISHGVERTVRYAEVNGELATVLVDKVPGAGYGLIQYRVGDDMTLYKIDESAVATALPAGDYLGNFDVTYRMDGTSAWQDGHGDIGLGLDPVTGTVTYGSMASAADTSVEFYGTATYANGAFSDNGATVVLRQDGNFVRHEAGSLNGIMVGDSLNSAAIGTVSATNAVTGFAAEGGFTAPLMTQP
ncbi:hypothetical protein [Defluviimonas salinarum]|uniref:Transferrin-binding protein B C-lobe/N-lobe beta barrel domain-containing protein n=1 Tax=Defluviimonas salinarum TaxID=2992147 RepID=A0ABT3J4C9_9RHOB|nr:hypothetical protein [Defluviimonas salinarum]MCW3782542.1 hypothetical protein [Defluviimonas salinarum]